MEARKPSEKATREHGIAGEVVGKQFVADAWPSGLRNSNPNMLTEKPSVVIEPTQFGKFFIRDKENRVWDGEVWRGFGMAAMYDTYPEAFRNAKTARAALEDTHV